jgi:hypothetical protein
LPVRIIPLSATRWSPAMTGADVPAREDRDKAERRQDQV